MCWSWQVSLGFAIAHWLGIHYLLRRNELNDKGYAMLLIPLAFQESMQFFGWLLIGGEDATGYSCGFLNKVSSPEALPAIYDCYPLNV
jgi:hypothetical protein